MERHMKKILLLLMTSALLFGTLPAEAAVKLQTEDNMQAVMSTLSIMQGYPDGEFYPELAVTRAEFSKMAVAASSWRNTVALGTSTSPFRDVSYTHWAAPYIKVASANKLITGYPDSTFRPEDNVTLAEAVTVAVKLLGYTDEDFSSAWPYGQMGVAQNIGLLDHIWAGSGDFLTRGQVRQLFYNTLLTKPKTGNANYIESLGYIMTEDVTLIATAEQDLSVGAGKVLASSGTYKINQYFDYSNVGRKGDILVNDNAELLLFFPEQQQAQSYNIYSVVGDQVVLYADGQISPMKLDTSLTLYYKSQKTTIKDMLAKIATGDVITLYSNADGVLDYAVMQEGTLIGPVTVQGDGWAGELGIGEGVTVMRDGSAAALSQVKTYDVVYYSPQLATVWAYSKKITGVYEKASPSKEQITSAVISGVTYDVSSIAAFAALGASGQFNIGDTVTLLIGRDGSVVDAISPTNAEVDSYVVYSVLDNDVIVYDNGNLTQLNLDKNTTAYFNSQKSTIGDLISKMEMGYVISVCRNSDNTIDYVTINSGKIEGPVTAYQTAWMASLNVQVSAVVMRDGKKVTANDIATYDIVYYSKDMNMVWAYSKKVTGVYEKAMPNKDSVTSVTISGTAYSIETAAAMKALSSSGEFALGDNVTLLLGKDGKIADVVSPENTNKEVYGYLLSVGNKEYTDANGNNITSYYAKLALADGTEMEYITRSNYESLRSSVVKLYFTDGVASVSQVAKSTDLSGVFSTSKGTIGSRTYAEDIEILDIGNTQVQYSGSYTTVFPQRIDGIELKASDVLYYEKNKSGEISALYLNDVTGDSAQYGIVTSTSESGNGGSYTCMLGSAATSISSSNTKYLVGTGSPVKVKMNGSQVYAMTALTPIRDNIRSITTLSISTDATEYPVSPNVVVYNEKYMVVPLEDIINNDAYRVEAYYDRHPNLGGQVRVIRIFEK